MSPHKVTRTAFAVLTLAFILGAPAFADIYRYVDEDGVWHFTNVYQGGHYRLYMRTTRKSSWKYIETYKSLIHQAAKKFGVEVSLIKAIIKAESDFDSQALSEKGAQGLMQLMPETADHMDVEDPFDPEENIAGGTKYLGLMLKRFNNDKRLAVAAYNAGPERVETAKGVPPIPETEQFVERVMSYYQTYNSEP